MFDNNIDGILKYFQIKTPKVEISCGLFPNNPVRMVMSSEDSFNESVPGAEEGCMRMLEILELGGALRREAERHCNSVNEAHLLVHQVMVRAFHDDPALVATGALHGELSSRLAAKLNQATALCL